MNGEPSYTDTSSTPESSMVQLTSELLKTIVVTMYTEGEGKFQSSEISVKWDLILPIFVHEAEQFPSEDGSIILLFDSTKSIQQVKTAAVETMKKADELGHLENDATSKLGSHIRARYCDSYLIRDAITSHNSREKSKSESDYTYPIKSLMELYQDLYGQQVADYITDQAITDYDEQAAFTWLTNKSYRDLTGAELGKDRETVLWNTKEGRTALVQGTRKTMEHLITVGAVAPEVVHEHGSHEAAERHVLQSLGLL